MRKLIIAAHIYILLLLRYDGRACAITRIGLFANTRVFRFSETRPALFTARILHHPTSTGLTAIKLGIPRDIEGTPQYDYNVRRELPAVCHDDGSAHRHQCA